MKFGKRLTALLLVFCMIAALCACSAEQESKDNKAESDVSDTTEDNSVSGELSDNDTPMEGKEISWDTYDTDSLTWEFDTMTSTLFISGNGPMRDYSTDYPAWYDYAESAAVLVVGDGVTTIGAYAFADFTGLSSVTLPDSIEIIDASAFEYCINLYYINIPQSLRIIGSRAFYNAIIHEPYTFAFPEGCEYIGDEVFHAALIDCEVVIPSTLTYMGTEPFTNAPIIKFTVTESNPMFCSLDGVLFSKDMKTLIQYPGDKTDAEYSVPDGVVRLEPLSFNIADKLERVNIPASVTDISESTFFFNYSMTEIITAEDNSAYKSVDGVLFTKDGKNLLAFPNAKTTDINGAYIVPDGTERICADVFNNCSDMKEVTLPETLKSIGEQAFCNTAITSINLPSGIEEIESYAFQVTEQLTDVYFSGSEAEWNSISIGENGNEQLLNATIHYDA